MIVSHSWWYLGVKPWLEYSGWPRVKVMSLWIAQDQSFNLVLTTPGLREKQHRKKKQPTLPLGQEDILANIYFNLDISKHCLRHFSLQIRSETALGWWQLYPKLHFTHWVSLKLFLLFPLNVLVLQSGLVRLK